MYMSDKIGDKGLPILKPLDCFNYLPLNTKVIWETQILVKLTNSFTQLSAPSIGKLCE